jgi:hypothetical protein
VPTLGGQSGCRVRFRISTEVFLKFLCGGCLGGWEGKIWTVIMDPRRLIPRRRTGPDPGQHAANMPKIYGVGFGGGGYDGRGTFGQGILKGIAASSELLYNCNILYFECSGIPLPTLRFHPSEHLYQFTCAVILVSLAILRTALCRKLGQTGNAISLAALSSYDTVFPVVLVGLLAWFRTSLSG